jgi:hypothetical protein
VLFWLNYKYLVLKILENIRFKAYANGKTICTIYPSLENVEEQIENWKGTEEKSKGSNDISNKRNVEAVNLESKSTGNRLVGLYKASHVRKEMQLCSQDIM